MGAKEEIQFDVECSRFDLAEPIEHALTEIGATLLTSVPDEGKYTAQTGVSLFSMRETIIVECQAIEPLNARTRVHASSHTAQLVDWVGKNRSNLQRFREALEKRLAVDSGRLAPGSNAGGAAMKAVDAVAAAASPRRRVFVSYRREDTSTVVGRLCDRLAADLGAENVFKDVDNIPFGVDFVEHLEREVEKCTVLFAVIGPEWLSAEGGKGRRIDDTNDFVRIEIATALKRQIPVVPLLVEGAAMPTADSLPDELKPLARRNGIEIRRDPDFHGDVTRLLSRLG